MFSDNVLYGVWPGGGQVVFGGEGAGLEMIVITGIRDGEHGVFKVSLGYAG